MPNYHEREQAVTPWSLAEELTLQAKGGPNVEPPTAAMFTALVENDNPAIQNLITEAASWAAYRGIGNGPTVSGLRTSLISYFRTRCKEHGQEFSDAALTTPQDWEKPFAMLAKDLQNDATIALDSVQSGIAFREAATPVKERYVSIAAVSQLVRDRFPHGIRALSIGCSIMVGELQLMHAAEFPMSFERVTIDKKQDVTDQANRLVGHESVFSQIVGVDIFPVYYEDKQRYDAGAAHYALSGLRPSERNNPAYFNTVRRLMDKKEKGKPGYTPDNGIIFEQANLANEQDYNDLKDKYPEPFDLILASYVTQELTPPDQIRFHELATELAGENGLIIYLHQAYIPNHFRSEPTPVTNVRHYKSYATVPYSSSMHVVDMMHPIKGVQQAMTFRDNRCQQVRLGAAKLMVNDSLEPISDLIKSS